MIQNNNFYIDDLNTIVFLGASTKYDALLEINNVHDLETIIITSPDQANWNSLKKIKHPINVFNELDSSFRTFVEDKVDTNKTLFVSLGSRWIFKKQLLEELFEWNLVNFHGSRLPLDGAGGGFSWRIMRNDRIDNQLVHLVDEGIDTGPILMSDKSLFPSYCKIPADFELHKTKNFLTFYCKFINLLKKRHQFLLKEQPDYLGRYNPRLDSLSNGWINWNFNSYRLVEFINAFDNPYPGASTNVNNKKYARVFIKKVQLHGGDSSNHPFMTGLISRHDENWIVVSTSDQNMLLIEEVIDEKTNTNIMPLLKPGDRFFTPNSKLEDAKSDRIFFSAQGLTRKD